MILVVGGGISGITAAVELAEVGKEVILIEEKPYLGGNVVKMHNYFPKLCPPICGLEINFRRIRQNPRVKVYTSTKLLEVNGEKGNFSVKLKSEAKYVKDNCTSCGKCVDVCPEERPNEFNYNFDKTKAIYLPHEMAFPMKYTIDADYCKKESCKKCVDVCEYNAIDFSAKEETFSVDVSSVIMATGWKNYDASKIEELKYSSAKNVITNLEYERFVAKNGPTKGKLLRPSDNKIPKNVVFVQCAGSRDQNHLPYCSAVCCSATLKHALSVQKKNPESNVKIFYIDLRVTGRNEDFLNKVKENKNIEFIKGKVAKIEEIKESNNLIVEAEDILNGKKISCEADLVVLATGIVPNDTILKTNNDKFLIEDKEGVFAVACSKKPMDVSTSVKEATSAALKAIQIVN